MVVNIVFDFKNVIVIMILSLHSNSYITYYIIVYIIYNIMYIFSITSDNIVIYIL